MILRLLRLPANVASVEREHRQAKRVALVSGGTRGLGRAIAQRLLGEGWNVSVCARRAPVDPIAVGSATAHVVTGDLRNASEAERVVRETLEQQQRIDLVVNNAGGTPYASLEDSSPALIEKIVALNLLAAIYLSRAALTALRSRNGMIVNIASISGRRPAPGTVAYGAAKAGLIAATEGMAMEWAPQVRCNALVVGLVDCPDQVDHYGDEETAARIALSVPMGRLASGSDVADCVAMLAADTARYLTGATIDLHGGGELPAFIALNQSGKN